MFTWVLHRVEVFVAMVAMVAGWLLGLVRVTGRVQQPGDSWDVGQAGRRAGQRGRPTLQQELPVIDDSSTCGCHTEPIRNSTATFGAAGFSFTKVKDERSKRMLFFCS